MHQVNSIDVYDSPESVVRPVPRRRGADAYDTLLWRLQPRLGESRVKSDGAGFLVGVTACDRKAGVSTVAANLAIRAADHQMRPVLLIDSACQQPADYHSIRRGLRSSPGQRRAGTENRHRSPRP